MSEIEQKRMPTNINGLEKEKTDLESQLRSIEQQQADNTRELSLTSAQVLTNPQNASKAAILREKGFALANRADALKASIAAKDGAISQQRKADQQAEREQARTNAETQIEEDLKSLSDRYLAFLQVAHSESHEMVELQARVRRNVEFLGCTIDTAEVRYRKAFPKVDRYDSLFLDALLGLECLHKYEELPIFNEWYDATDEQREKWCAEGVTTPRQLVEYRKLNRK